MRARARGSRDSSKISLRENASTSFTRILGELVTRVAGAYSAVLVDADGETVDYAGSGDPFDMKVGAAHVRILLGQLALLSTGPLEALNVRGTRSSFVARVLPDGYALVVQLRPRATLLSSKRALDWATWSLACEAGWPTRPPDWLPIEVDCDADGRPLRAKSQNAEPSKPMTSYAAVVLGTVRGLPSREIGYRVRLENAVEATLIREAGNRWYADVDIESEESRKPPPTPPPLVPNRAGKTRESARKHRER